MKDHQHTEELRLGYVTFTRPRSLLLGSGHWWGPSQKKPRGPSDFLRALHDHCAAGHGEIEAWADEPEEDEENPALHAATADQLWPLPLDDAALAPPPGRRRDGPGPPGDPRLPRGRSPRGRTTDPTRTTTRTGPRRRTTSLRTRTTNPHDDGAARRGRRFPRRGRRRLGRLEHGPSRTARADPTAPRACRTAGHDRPPTVPHARRHPAEADLTPEEARAVASWDRDLDALTGELLPRAGEPSRDVPLPAVADRHPADAPGRRPGRLRAGAGPPHAAPTAARRPPGHPLPRLGRVPLRGTAAPHARSPRNCPAATPRSPTNATCRPSRTPSSAPRTPTARRTGSRPPSSSTLAGRVVRGRIDAVYKEGDGADATYEIVDWKTNRAHTADPLQLAVYRLAWAEQQGVPPEAVGAAFLYVRSGELVRPGRAPGPGRAGAAAPGRACRVRSTGRGCQRGPIGS